MSDLAIVSAIFGVWVAAYLGAILADLHRIGDWPDLPLRTRVWRSIKDTGQPMYYVHMFYGECSRPWCYCHTQPISDHKSGEGR
jgi:hypothetical protein